MIRDGRDVRLYYREGCHLCDELAAFVFRHWPEVGAVLQWVDIERDRGLFARYDREVPVLECQGEVVCRSGVDVEALTRSFGPPRIPV